MSDHDQLFDGIPENHHPKFRAAVLRLISVQRKVCLDRLNADHAWARGRKGDSTSMHGDAHFQQKAINDIIAAIERLKL